MAASLVNGWVAEELPEGARRIEHFVVKWNHLALQNAAKTKT